MTEREWARRCIRGGFSCLGLVLAGLLGRWLGWIFCQWVKG